MGLTWLQNHHKERNTHSQSLRKKGVRWQLTAHKSPVLLWGNLKSWLQTLSKFHWEKPARTATMKCNPAHVLGAVCLQPGSSSSPVFRGVLPSVGWVPDRYLHAVVPQLPLLKGVPFGIPLIRLRSTEKGIFLTEKPIFNNNQTLPTPKHLDGPIL